jgi:hypothetical protein
MVESSGSLGIGELNEQPLHAALKDRYAGAGDRLEARVDGYVIDILRGDRLIEIQTGHFSALKDKLRALVRDHPVTLIYPIAREKWLYKLPKPDWDGPRRRKSPRRGRLEEVFEELVSFPELLADERFILQVVLIQEEEVRRFTGRKMWWNNGWERVERRLLDVVEERVFSNPDQLGGLLPPELPDPFTTADLARSLESNRRLAQKMAYCLRKLDLIEQVGRQGRSYLYRRA